MVKGTTNRFKISFETTEDRVGKMMTVLTDHDCVITGCEIMTQVPTYEHTAPVRARMKGTGEQTYSTEAMMTALKGHTKQKPASLDKIRETFVSHHLSARTASTALSDLIKLGLVERVGQGLYAPTQRAATLIKPKAKPAKVAKAKVRPKPTKVVHATHKLGARDFIIMTLQKSGPMEPKAIREKLEHNGFSPSSWNSAVFDLLKAKRLTKGPDGIYAAAE
jgi:hypothetical protein